jgi:hypothetical protein
LGLSFLDRVHEQTFTAAKLNFLPWVHSSIFAIKHRFVTYPMKEVLKAVYRLKLGDLWKPHVRAFECQHMA